MSRLCDSHSPFQTCKSLQMRDISQSVTIFLRNAVVVPTRNALNLLHHAALSGNSQSIAGHNKNEFP
ncbi:hypothetical protein EMIT093MI4_120185 [Pseudomonas sp. IT-93MI4]